MGLLSDTQNRRKMGTLIVDHYCKVIVISFIAGILWFLALASDLVNNKTYFSENALLPGVVVRDFNPGTSPSRLLESLKEENNVHSSLPHAWIQGHFRQIGLDVYAHNFTLNYPFGTKPQYSGVNIYAILRAPKSCSTEALVLSTPYRGRDSIHDTTLPSIVLMIELARYFRQHSYWSKDVIFLITEHEMIGFQAWLNAYHNLPASNVINHGSLNGASGLIQGVINLEISHTQFSYIDVKIEGLNGQLPNLDMFNLVVELCSREMVTPLFQGRKMHSSNLPLDSWLHNLKTMLSMVTMQAMGLPTGAHGLFHQFGIQAVTLTSHKVNSKKAPKVNLIYLGRIVEGICRSLNNLLEKFHQSFFFYLLPSTRHYVSIGLYMPPFVLIAAPVLVKALYVYIQSRISTQEKNDLMLDSGFSVWSTLDILTSCHGLGLLIYFSHSFMNHFQTHFAYSTEDSLYYLHLALMVISILFMFVQYKRLRMSAQNYLVKLCIVLLEIGAFLYTLSLINISLATVLSVLYVPISVCVGYRGLLSSFRYIYLLFINPLMLTYLIVLGQSYFVHTNSMWNEHLVTAVSGHKKVVLYTVEDMYFFGNWNYKIVTLILIPIWLELWSLASVNII